MIDVNDIYLMVQDVSGKDQAGYMDNEQYNRYLRMSSELLFEYYHSWFEKNRTVHNALRPFITSKNLNVVNAQATLPDDYRNIIDIKALINSAGVKTESVAHDLKHHEDVYINTSPIRKPRRGLYAYRIAGDIIEWRPTDYTGKIRLEYFKKPEYGERVTEINVVTDVEEYDEANSTQSEWNETELVNIVDIILGFKGIQIRESEILTWLKDRKKLFE